MAEEESTTAEQPTHDEIADVARQYWQDGGQRDTAEQDWRDAEELLKDKSTQIKIRD